MNKINYALAEYAISFPACHSKARDKFQKDGLRGCFGILNLFKKAKLALTRSSRKKSVNVGEIVKFSDGVKIRHSDGSLRNTKV